MTCPALPSLLQLQRTSHPDASDLHGEVGRAFIVEERLWFVAGPQSVRTSPIESIIPTARGVLNLHHQPLVRILDGVRRMAGARRLEAQDATASSDVAVRHVPAMRYGAGVHRLFGILLLCSVSFGGRAALAQDACEPLTVITWNLESGDSDIELLAAWIESQAAHVWALQEVHADWFEMLDEVTEPNSTGYLSDSGGGDRLAMFYDAERLELVERVDLDALNPGGRVRAPPGVSIERRLQRRRALGGQQSSLPHRRRRPPGAGAGIGGVDARAEHAGARRRGSELRLRRHER